MELEGLVDCHFLSFAEASHPPQILLYPQSCVGEGLAGGRRSYPSGLRWNKAILHFAWAKGVLTDWDLVGHLFDHQKALALVSQRCGQIPFNPCKLVLVLPQP